MSLENYNGHTVTLESNNDGNAKIKDDEHDSPSTTYLERANEILVKNTLLRSCWFFLQSSLPLH